MMTALWILAEIFIVKQHLSTNGLACSNSVNCFDYCSTSTKLQPRHCFKGTCVNDAEVDCAGSGMICIAGAPDSVCWSDIS